jgi:cell division protein FtsX
LKEGLSLVWIDWRLAGGTCAVQSLGRFAVLLPLAFAFLALFLSGGAARFLSSQYAVTAMLRQSASPEEAIGLTKKVAALPPVRSAEYRDSASAWKEFLEAYPGVESIPGAADNPLPGYIEIRIRHDRFTPSGVETVLTALKPVELVDKLLAGEESLPRIFRVKRALNALSFACLGLLAALFFAVCRLQDRLRSASMSGDIGFLLQHGVSERRLEASRAAGAAASGFVLAAVAAASAAAALHFLLGRYPFLEGVIGTQEELLSIPAAAAAFLFVLLAALMFAAASLLGWAPARPAGER